MPTKKFVVEIPVSDRKTDQAQLGPRLRSLLPKVVGVTGPVTVTEVPGSDPKADTTEKK